MAAHTPVQPPLSHSREVADAIQSFWSKPTCPRLSSDARLSAYYERLLALEGMTCQGRSESQVCAHLKDPTVFRAWPPRALQQTGATGSAIFLSVKMATVSQVRWAIQVLWARFPGRLGASGKGKRASYLSFQICQTEYRPFVQQVPHCTWVKDAMRAAIFLCIITLSSMVAKALECLLWLPRSSSSQPLLERGRQYVST